VRAIPIPLRRRIDYFLTGVRGRKRYYTALAGVVVAIVGFIATPFGLNVGWVVGVTGLVLSAAQFVPDWIAARRGSVQLVAVQPDVRFDDLEIGSRTLVRSESGSAVADPEVDALLPDSQATVSWSRSRTPLPDALAPHAYDALRARITSPNVFNGKLVRQDVDLNAENISRGGTVTFSTTTYFSLLLTNYMEQGVRNSTTRRWIQHPRDLVDDGHGSLQRLSDSQLANAIGVSTLAFTTDGKVGIILQSASNNSAGGELAPSGSGSLDLRDLPRRGNRRDRLVDVVTHGMERELCEEGSIRPSEIAWTIVLGYFRWMEKGAKPEYVGITKLNKHSRELHHRSVAFAEIRYVADRSYGSVDLAALKADPEDPSALCVDDLPGRPSLPLVMCLRAIGEAMRRGGELGKRIEELA
jgi:hypothetical protein